jgi:GNAT superfamily N-acetyltransferase
MSGFKREKFGAIDMMAVTARYRRRGIGTTILGKILDWFRSQNIDLIELSVASGNKVGYPFWKKHGFKAYLHRLYLKPFK